MAEGTTRRVPSMIERLETAEQDIKILADRYERLYRRFERQRDRVDTVLGSEPTEAEPEMAQLSFERNEKREYVEPRGRTRGDPMG